MQYHIEILHCTVDCVRVNKPSTLGEKLTSVFHSLATYDFYNEYMIIRGFGATEYYNLAGEFKGSQLEVIVGEFKGGQLEVIVKAFERLGHTDVTPKIEELKLDVRVTTILLTRSNQYGRVIEAVSAIKRVLNMKYRNEADAYWDSLISREDKQSIIRNMVITFLEFNDKDNGSIIRVIGNQATVEYTINHLN